MIRLLIHLYSTYIFEKLNSCNLSHSVHVHVQAMIFYVLICNFILRRKIKIRFYCRLA